VANLRSESDVLLEGVQEFLSVFSSLSHRPNCVKFVIRVLHLVTLVSICEFCEKSTQVRPFFSYRPK
jgi:hypothetical protein